MQVHTHVCVPSPARPTTWNCQKGTTVVPHYMGSHCQPGNVQVWLLKRPKTVRRLNSRQVAPGTSHMQIESTRQMPLAARLSEMRVGTKIGVFHTHFFVRLCSSPGTDCTLDVALAICHMCARFGKKHIPSRVITSMPHNTPTNWWGCLGLQAPFLYIFTYNGPPPLVRVVHGHHQSFHILYILCCCLFGQSVVCTRLYLVGYV